MPTADTRCAACRTNTSTDRCSRQRRVEAFCNYHARLKKPRIWTLDLQYPGYDARKTAKLQALIRGWLVRLQNSWRGPGLLDRRHVSNEDELVSGDSKYEVPLDAYFSFREPAVPYDPSCSATNIGEPSQQSTDSSGNVTGKSQSRGSGGSAAPPYWFDVASLHKWTYGKLSPTNPYTRQPIPMEARERLRKVVRLLAKRGTRLNDQALSAIPNLDDRAWALTVDLVCRYHEMGLTDVRIAWFLELNNSDRFVIMQMLFRLWTSMPENVRRSFAPRIQHTNMVLELLSKHRWYGFGFSEAAYKFSDTLHKLLDLPSSPNFQTTMALLVLNQLSHFHASCAQLYS